MTKFRQSPQVEHFIQSLAPDPKKAVRAGIKCIANHSSDVKHLEGDLTGWQRLRVQNYRIIFKEIHRDGTRIIDCVYANRRSIVYELFRELLKNQLLKDN
ncbi:MAG TPA: hypothetical protein VE344_09570 [Methylomirabilota bacterium]|nr:hypothetical protein [Methylomirabilota bacterium]